MAAAPDDQPASGRGHASHLPWAVACALLFVALAVARGSVWHHAHDEGVTNAQSFGDLQLPNAAADPPRPLAEIYARLGGDGRHGPDGVLEHLMRRGGMHPPLYYLALNRWAGLAGTEHAALALPSIALGVLSLLAFARVARRVVPEAGRVPWALAFFAVSPWLGGMSNYLRPYAVALCLALVATAAALECLDSRPRGAARVVFVVASALGLYTIYPYAFVLLWHGVLLTAALWRRPREERKREFLVLGAMAGCIALAYAPWLPRLALHVAGADDPEWYFSGALPLAAWPQQAWVTLRTFFLGEKFGGALPRWGLVALAIATAPLVLRAFRSAGRASLDPTARLFWAAAPVLPLLILASDALRGTHMLVATKLNFACLPLLLLLVARACAAAPRPAWRAGLASAWLALLLGTSLANIALHARLTVSAELLARKIAGEPHDGEWFVLSSAHWGFVYPTLLSWRDAGVRGGALLVASQAELPALLARAHDDPDVRGVLLIGLSSGWRNDGAWQADELQRLAAERLAAGWQVGAGPAGPAGKRLRVAPDVYPYFYSM